MVEGIEMLLTAAATGFGNVSFVITFVADTREFMIGAGTFSGAFVTVLQTSANNCNWVVLTSGTDRMFALVVAVVLVEVNVMQVFTEGMIGIIGITTKKN